jgi:hypothetical protein
LCQIGKSATQALRIKKLAPGFSGGVGGPRALLLRPGLGDGVDFGLSGLEKKPELIKITDI